ncbi:larval cuticle protein LCP-17-like [Atheta coriaria]|uniref:larval cuticle protein LCP-17-like n=1 Tax=Dalotia coriaria TaxID=877792 RepID=UPI0031F374FC
MKYLILLALVAAAYAFPQEPVPIVRSESNIEPDGKYHYAYETGDGIKAEQQGEPRQIGNEVGIAASGQFSFTSADGTPISVTYTADENGYQPVGDHIPQVPAAIAKALEWIKAHPEPENQKH